jgi:hypothetical protein
MRLAWPVVKMIFLTWFGFSIAGLLYIALICEVQPFTDGTDKIPFVTVLLSPLVMMVYQCTVLGFTLIVTPIAYWCTVNKNILSSFVFSFSSVFVFVVLAVYSFQEAAIIGSLIVSIVSLVICRFSDWRIFRPLPLTDK